MSSVNVGKDSKWPGGLFLVVAILSLKVTTASNYLVGYWLRNRAPGMAWLADAVVPSLIASFAICLAIRPKGILRLPDQHTDWPRLFRVAGLWLCAWLVGCSIAAIHAGHWIKYMYATHNSAEILGFTLIGPFAEELLFRGALFDLAERVFPENSRARVLSTSVIFMLFHLQFQDFRFTRAALGQMAFAFPLGLALGAIRNNSKSLWPGLVLHVLTNLPGIFGS